ncbi:DUF1654 domain-containing protein [Azomonas macrocytogenes]|uniref:DUF1654 domain-containing protein n=1 Tax=Azomonas macrocytogenes TaxID=69962 RepID=A0A839T722_AZOMA|nr:DUF1654 domain-containing protein [Azomonas macrocytogenes]MBB3103755.1 hypothetical protein [Azomonas macrocytogenes]
MSRSIARSITALWQVSSYDRMVRRINGQLSNLCAHNTTQASIQRLPGERDDDWERLLDELRIADNVAVEAGRDCAHLSWGESENE